MNNQIVTSKLRMYEGRTVDDFLFSDLCEIFSIDIYKVNGKEIGWGEDYEPDYRRIESIEIRNVMGYTILDIATEVTA